MPATIATTDLTATQRRRGITALMLSTFFSWAGFFLVIPLVAVHYVDDLGWAAGTVGIVLAVRQLTQQSLTTVFGMVADRVGPKPLITIGMLIRVLGFVSMAWADSFVTVLGSLLLAGIGGSMFESPKAAAFAALAAPEERQRLFSKVGVVSGVGTTVGTQVGALLIPYDFSVVCLVGAAAYVVIFVQMMVLLPHIRVSTGSHSAVAGLGLVFHDRRFMAFLIILCGYWFCTTQFGLTITLAATRITGSDAAVSWIYAVNAVATIGLGYILPRFLERWMSSLMLLISGTLILGGGLALVGFAGSTLAILIAAAVFSLGSILSRPGQETVIANLADPAARGTYFGVAALSLAVGGSLGNYLGGVIYSSGSGEGNAAGPWLVFAGVAVVTSIALVVYRARYPMTGSTEPELAGGATGVPDASILASAPAPNRSSSSTMI
jgi:DHA1 family multidrug resistance protein-like MFS transporter